MWISNWRQDIDGKDWTLGTTASKKWKYDPNKNVWWEEDDVFIGDVPEPNKCVWIHDTRWQKTFEDGLAVAKVKELLEELAKLEKADREYCSHCNRHYQLSETERARLQELRTLLKGLNFVETTKLTVTDNNC